MKELLERLCITISYYKEPEDGSTAAVVDGPIAKHELKPIVDHPDFICIDTNFVGQLVIHYNNHPHSLDTN